MFRAAHLSKHVEPSKNFGIIKSITKLHLVGISTEFIYSVAYCVTVTDQV